MSTSGLHSRSTTQPVALQGLTMATVMIVEEVVEVIEDSDPHVVPSLRKVRRRCPMETVASTSSSTQSNTECTPRPRKLAKKRSRGFSKSLQALEDKKKMRKIAARRVKYGKSSLSAISSLKMRKFKAKCDKHYDREMQKRRESMKRLQEEHRALKAQSVDFIDECQRLVETTREMRVQAERRRSMSLAVLLSHLAQDAIFY